MRELYYPSLFALRQEAQGKGGRDSDDFQGKIKEVLFGKKGPKETREDVEVSKIRPVNDSDYGRILEWFSDPETQGHLDPLPELPEDWKDDNQLRTALFKLHEYYINNGEPEKITSLVAANSKDKAVGVVTIRWRGDPWVPKGHKIASIERLLVNPRIRGRGVGSKLVEESLRVAFEERDYEEVRAWVMSDEKAGLWQNNVQFFRKFGFGLLGGENNTWREYAKKRNLGENAENRDAIWLQLKKEKWLELKNPQAPTPSK